MADTCSDAVTRALDQRRSRRDALRLLGGGALGALALAARHDEAAALSALRAGWTHLAGTTTGLLCYQGGTGDADTGTCVDGRYTQKAAYAGFNPGWTHVVGAGRGLFLYQKSDGLAASGYLSSAGEWVFPQGAVYSDRFPAGWKRFAGTRSGRFVGYFGPDLAPDALTADGYLEESRRDPDVVAGGWTHLAGAGADAFLFYRGDTGAAVTGRVARADFHGLSHYFWVAGTTYQLAKGFTHVAGTFNGGLLFYNRVTGKGISGYLDAAGAWHRTSPQPLDLGVGWTHVVGAGGRGLLFYKSTTGKGVGGFLTNAGAWTKTTTYG